MKKTINYIVILILGIFIGCFIRCFKLEKNVLHDAWNSLVYIESFDEETIKSGSGFVYKTDNNKAYIITSYHVVSGYTNIYIYKTSKKKEEANIVAYNEDSDIAVLSIDNNLDLKEINIGNSDSVEIGNDIYVLGTPLNIDYISTLSKGIVSFVNREITITTPYGIKNYNTIQVDAMVDEGNSGGPLLNDKGEVIGMMFVKEENIDGIGFALPINYVMNIIENLEHK